MIGVTGVGGQLGRLVVGELLERVDAARIVGLSHSPERLDDLPIASRQADFADRDGLVKAFDNLDGLLIISLPPLPERGTLQANAVAAAATAGISHLVYTSFTRAGEPGNPVSVVPEHRETERLIADSGLPSTVLRFNMWPQMLLMLGTATGAVAKGTLLSNAGDGRVAYVTREDSAAVAAAALADGLAIGELLEVSGPAAVSDAEFAAILTEVAGTLVRHQDVDDDTALSAWLADGLPERYAQALVANGEARRAGWYELTSHAVQRLTGKPPTQLADFLITHRDELTS